MEPNTLQSTAKKTCKQYHWRSWKGVTRTFSGGRKEQGGVWFSLVIRKSLSKGVTFQLRPAGISQVYGGGWRAHSCLGQELVLEAARRPEKTSVVRTLGTFWGRGWEEDMGQVDREGGMSEDNTQTLESSTIWEVRWQWAENPGFFWTSHTLFLEPKLWFLTLAVEKLFWNVLRPGW